MVSRQCRHCGAEFRVETAQLKYEGYGRFCSRKCHYASRRTQPHADIATPEGRVLVYSPDSPMANHQGHVYRYRIVAAATLGRPLTSDEQVHHINGDPTDDRPENLEVLSRAEHRLRHAAEDALKNGYDLATHKRCRTCTQIKLRSEFSPNSTRGRRTLNSQCRPCAAEWQRDYKARRKQCKML